MSSSIRTAQEQRGTPDVAEKFFDLVKRRKELWHELRSSDVTEQEGTDSLREGNAQELLEKLKNPVPTKKSVRADLNKQRELETLNAEIHRMMADPFARGDIQRSGKDQLHSRQKNKKIVDEYRALFEIQDLLDAQDYTLIRKKSFTEKDREILKRNATFRTESRHRLGALAESPETARVARLAQLMTYREQIHEHKFAVTPSRQAVIDEVRSLWSRKQAVLLTGSTGTGKTELFAYLTKKLYGRPLSRLIRASQDTTSAEIFGKMGLRATKNGGTETVFQPGVYMDAIDQGMPFVIDEFNLLETQTRMGLKELYNRGPGDSIVIQQDSGKEHEIQEGFVIGATANVKGKKHKDRFELDAAETRAFESRRVPFLPKEELYDVIIASFMNGRGEVRLAREDATDTLKRLLEAVELTQQAYEEKQTQFFAEGSGAKKTPALLEKAVIDPGRILKMLRGWPKEDVRGKTFIEFLETELLHIIHTEDYPEKDRRLLLQIFITKGFFNGTSVKDFDVPGIDETKLTAWNWKATKPPSRNTQTLSSAQVADLDPFGLRTLRASAAADEFLRKKEQTTSEGIRTDLLPASVRVLLEETVEAMDIPVDLPAVREQWVEYYNRHGLQEILKDANGRDLIPDTIRLTPAQQEIFKQKYAEGYTRVILVPAGIEKHLDALKKQLADGYEKDAQGEPISTYLGNPKDSFPNEITTTDSHRLSKPYLLLTNPSQALHPNSKNKTADTLIAEFNAQGLTGLSLADFFIEEREHFEKTGKHLIDGATIWSWLLSSKDRASRVLGAGWDPSDRRVEVGSDSSGDSLSHLGARSSVVLPLDP